MNFKKAAIGAAAIVSTMLLISITTEARPFRPGGGRGPGLGGLRFLLELKLSGAQQVEMLNIINRYRAAGENMRAGLRAAGKNLRAALQADPFNEEAVRNAYRELCALKEERLVARAKMMADLKAVLTPEQRQQLEQRRAQRIERMSGGFGAQPEEKPQ